MNRSDLIRATADQLGCTKEEIETILETLLQMIGVSLACGENVSLHRFGTFEPRLKKETIRKNPQTGADIYVPEKKTVLFRPSPKLKDRINRGKP